MHMDNRGLYFVIALICMFLLITMQKEEKKVDVLVMPVHEAVVLEKYDSFSIIMIDSVEYIFREGGGITRVTSRDAGFKQD
jgi:hypothetical protein